MVRIGNTTDAHKTAQKNMFDATKFGAKTPGVKGDTAGTRGSGLSVRPMAPIKPMGATPKTGGVTPYGNDRGPSKQMKDNLMNTHKRQTQQKYNTGPNLGRLEKNTPGYSNPYGKTSGVTQTTLDTYNRKPGVMERITDSFKNFFGQDDSLMPNQQIGRGVNLQSMFQDCGKPGSPKKKLFITSDEDKK
jgi:hypothetical protein